MLTHSLQEPPHLLHKIWAPWGPLPLGLESHLLLPGSSMGPAASGWSHAVVALEGRQGEGPLLWLHGTPPRVPTGCILGKTWGSIFWWDREEGAKGSEGEGPDARKPFLFSIVLQSLAVSELLLEEQPFLKDLSL